MSVTKIVLTGGPCGGKTTMLSKMVSTFSEKGYKVLVVPEGATELIPNGIIPGNCGISMEFFQDIIIQRQLDKEKLYDMAVEAMDQDKVLIIYDRGLMDGQAYVSNEDFDKSLSHFGLTRQSASERYDAVIHLVTAANGAEAAYTTSNNVARRETVEEARAVDAKTMAAWVGHSHLRVIDNSTNFEKKIQRAMNEVYAVLGEPVPLEIERKYLVEKPDLSALLDHGALKSDIIQTYLVSEGETERRVRQRGSNGEFTFYYTEKVDLSGMEREERERKIRKSEYLDLLMQADTSIHQLRKTRYCFVWNNQYFELDTYPFSDDNALMEIELTDKNDEVNLPPFINVIREVTDDKKYRNHQIAERQSL